MKRLVSLIISLLILALIYWQIDAGAILQVFRASDLFWLLISLSCAVPLTLITAWRFQRLVPPRADLSFAEANRLILAASVLNMVLPSKMGDLAKAWFMRGKGSMDGALAVSLVVFEKSCDMLALLAWCALGLLLYPQKSGLIWLFLAAILAALISGLLFLGSARFLRVIARIFNGLAPKTLNQKLNRLWQGLDELQSFFKSHRRRALGVAAISLFLWFLHLLQIWWFTLALHAFVPFLASLALAPLAILAGLMPFTFAGVGTRDVATILLYQPYFDAPTGAALGLLLTSRYLLPALFGLPFLGRYLIALRGNSL